MPNNYIYLTYPFKSSTVQHVFLIYNSERWFKLENRNVVEGAVESSLFTVSSVAILFAKHGDNLTQREAEHSRPKPHFGIASNANFNYTPVSPPASSDLPVKLHLKFAYLNYLLKPCFWKGYV